MPHGLTLRAYHGAELQSSRSKLQTNEEITKSQVEESGVRAGATLRKPGCKFALNPNVGSCRLELDFGDFLTVPHFGIWFLGFGPWFPFSFALSAFSAATRLPQCLLHQPQRTQGSQRGNGASLDSYRPFAPVSCPRPLASSTLPRPLEALFRPKTGPQRTIFGRFITVNPCSPRQTCGSTPAPGLTPLFSGRTTYSEIVSPERPS